jgi:glycosyltransferase involved in cell wall biosynthesis
MTPRDLPLVTALVTFHNQARFVRPALDSVLGQSYPRLETVVVDDGSTDGTAAECARYGDRIRVISRENGGVALARNTGLQAARGNYIAHLDGDDVWHPEKIARQVDAALRHPGAGMVIADGHVFREDHPDEHGGPADGQRPRRGAEPLPLRDPDPAPLLRHSLADPRPRRGVPGGG